MNSVSYTRWDPKSRAGAVAVRSRAGIDVRAVEAFSDNVTDWARYQDLAGDTDNVESCSIAGHYDWRSYIREEAQFARRREEQAKPQKKADPVEAPKAPSDLYA